MADTFDIVIAGNGILGYATAFALTQESPGVRIAIVGPSAKPGCASIAAGAMLNSFAEVEAGALDAKYGRPKFELNLQSTRMWPDWVEAMNRAIGEAEVRINFGTYIIHNARADQMDDENFAAIVEALDFYKEKYERVDPKQIAGVSPAPQSRSLEAIYVPGEGSLKSKDLARSYEKIFAKNKNIELIDDLAAQVDIKDSGNKALVTAKGRKITAPILVLANGARAQDLIDQIPAIRNNIPRMFYGVGTAFIAKTDGHAPQKVVRTPNRGMACGIHVVPYEADVCYVGASNFISPVPEYSPRMSSFYTLLQTSMEQIHTRFYKAQILKWVVGHRPTTVDTFPLLGETSVKGLWIISGTKREGLHMSPIYSKSIALEICGKKGLFEHRFRPEREPIVTMTKEEGIKKAIRHMRSAAFQHELQLPKAGWDDMVDGMLRAKVEAIYQKCGITDFGIPPELLDMYNYGHAQKRI